MSRLVFWVAAVLLFGVTFLYQGLYGTGSYDYEAPDVAESEVERNGDADLAGMGGPVRWLQRPGGRGPRP